MKVNEKRAILTVIESIKIRLDQLRYLDDICPLCKKYPCQKCPISDANPNKKPYIRLSCSQYSDLLTDLRTKLWNQRNDLEFLLRGKKP